MYRITKQQVDYILSDIKRRGVEMEDLQLNLLDHICCMVEQNLKEGEDFEAFYKKTIPKFFKRELWELEEETITLLTFKHYYAMKKIMMTTGAISVAALLFGSFFKIMHWPGAGVMLVLGIASLSLIFLPLLFILKARESGAVRDKVVGAIGTAVGILLCTATLFKIMHWPGAGLIWILISASSIFLFIPLYFFTGIRKPETKMNTIVTSIILVGATGLLFSLTSIQPSVLTELSLINSDINLMHLTFDLKRSNTENYQFRMNDSSFKKKSELRHIHEGCKNLYKAANSLQEMLANEIRGDFKYSEHFDSTWTSFTISSDWENPTRLLFDTVCNSNHLRYIEDHDNHKIRSSMSPVWEVNIPSKLLAYIKIETNKMIEFAHKHFPNAFVPSPDEDGYGLQDSYDYKKDTIRVVKDSITGDYRIAPPKDAINTSWEMQNFYQTQLTIVMRNLMQVQIKACLIENAVLLSTK